MRRFEREVVDHKLIEAMLKEMNIANIGMNDEDDIFDAIDNFVYFNNRKN